MGETLTITPETDDTSQRVLAVQASTEFVQELIDEKQDSMTRSDVDGTRRDVLTAPGGETLTRSVTPGSPHTFELATDAEKTIRKWEIGGDNITVSRSLDSGEPEVSIDTSEDGLKALRTDLFNIFRYPETKESYGQEYKKPKRAVHVKAVIKDILDDM